jgi:hypothetical protein
VNRKLYLYCHGYWRHFPLWAWWFAFLGRFEKCMSCGRRNEKHDIGCYFA